MAAGKLIVAAALVAAVNADIYLHNPRGSNNRLDEARRDRNNANRLFDSQNNNRGGSNVGSLYFYEGEKVPMEWTNQHGCGNTANDCQMVVQYMCDPRLRDGVTTRTIPQNPSQCLNNDCNTDTRYGMHESYDYYMNCRYRFRNRGLFTADRNLNGNTARFTRQNNNGNRRGYECPEERDYYPYWHPTPWIDLAIQTNNPERCSWYQAESENVKGREYCSMPDAWYHHMISRGGNGNNGFIPNTQARCEALNNPTSPMMSFLATREQAYTVALNAVVDEEFARCTAQMGSFQTVCPLANATSGCPEAVTFFSTASNFVTETQIDAACPVCNGTDVAHPYSECPMCGPAACGMASAWSNATEVNGTITCPAGFVMDTNSAWCISTSCATNFTALTSSQQRWVDSCKAALIEGKIAVSGSSVDEYACLRRNITTATCRASASRTSWLTQPPHNSRIPSLTAPQCTKSQWSRTNHLGNGMGGVQNGWNLTVPSYIAERCAFRVRYNITTLDYGALDHQESGEVNSTFNKRPGNNPAKINVGANFDISTTRADMPYENARGYLWRQNPRVTIMDMTKMVRYCRGGVSENRMPDQDGFPTMCQIGGTGAMRTAGSAFCPADTTMVNVQVNASTGATIANPCGTGNNGLFCQKADGTITKGLGCTTFNGAGVPSRELNNNGLRNQGNTPNGDKDFRLQLAINTNQFGRTFQDRSHSHQIRALTEDLRLDCNRIYVLNVRGKRGNIVQTYPGIEYDFVLNTLEVSRGD
jgi:hypothetical protein